eukprot:5431258-Pyramimonas_sp.AAC.1
MNSTTSNPTANPICSKAGLGLQNASPALCPWIRHEARARGLDPDGPDLSAERVASSAGARTPPTIS